MPARPLLPLLAIPALLLLSACGGGSGADTSSDAQVVTVTLTDGGCAPSPSSVPAGPTTFKVSNEGAGSVSELELKKDGRVLGEKENLAPGLSGQFSLDLGPGAYELECPGAGTDETEFTVTAASASP